MHCAHGYLFSQFINPFKNERKDEYGGSLENCCRIATETLDAIRKVVPRSFPVSIRVNGAEGDFRPGGAEWDMKYMREVVKLLVPHGVDLVSVSMGGMDCMPNPDMKAGYRDAIIKNIKDVVDVPVAAVNCLKTPEEAEAMLASDVADMAVLGCQLICDPEWANKAQSGHAEDILPCLSCNHCIQQSNLQAPVRCMNWNPWTDMLALEAVRKIFKNLPIVLENPNDLDARAAIKFASMIDGIAMCAGGLTLGHGIAQTLGALWHVSHGVGCAWGLVPSVRQGLKVDHNNPERYTALAQAMGLTVPADATMEQLADMICDDIERLMDVAKIPTIKSLGHTVDEIPAVVEAGMKDPCNFCCVSADELTAHLEYLFNK